MKKYGPLAQTIKGMDPEPNPWDERLAAATNPEQVRALRRIAKGLSPAVGNKDRRTAQLVGRIKRRRNYRKPVRGGTGKQARTRRRSF